MALGQKLLRSLLVLDLAPYTACRAVAEKKVYDLGNWSLRQFFGFPSDTAWYVGPGWQDVWPQ